MPGNKNESVFDMQSSVVTTCPVPTPGSENHAPDGSQANLDRMTNTSFVRDMSFGQYQDLTRTDDYVEHFQNNQIVTVGGSQSTTAQQKITITSAENEIHVIAATTITLEVGQSRIVMTKDGKIEITGVDIEIKASGRNTIVGQQRVDINPLAPPA